MSLGFKRLITNLMHWLLFIHKILYCFTCFESQVLIFRRIRMYTCSIWYCHSLREFVVVCRCTDIEENTILWINNNQYIKLVINIYYVVYEAVWEGSFKFMDWIFGEILISYCPSRAVTCRSGPIGGLSVEIVVRCGSCQNLKSKFGR